MENQRRRARHSVSLTLALISLIGVSALLMAPSRHASAQSTASWSYTGSLITGRWDHTATVLQDGRVLVAGGYSECCPPASFAGFLKSAEVYDPSTGTWSSTGNMNIDHRNHSATLLPNGKVLVVGGGGNTPLAGLITELYDPNTGAWTITGNLNTRRFNGLTTTLLPNGKVLVVGGADKTTELYDPLTGTWSYSGSLSSNPVPHSATLLPNGKVLVAGSYTCSGPDGEDCVPNNPELYDPSAGTWSIVSGTHFGWPVARLLNTGKVLFVWSAELYDPTTGMWSATGSPSRNHSTATLLSDGKVLVACENFDASSPPPTASELYDPATGTWSDTASLNKGRNYPTATRLLNGKVLVVGGYNYVSSGPGFLRDTLNSAELYDPGTSEVSSPTPTPTATSTPTATPTPTPTPTPTATPTAASPTWTVTGSLNTGRDSQTATLLPNGKVLVVGGNENNGTLKSVELYDPATGTWTNTSSLNTSSAFHTATLLPNGKVLVAGGFTCGPPPQTCASLNGAELYDPSTGAWTNTGNLNAARDGHAAILLQNGKVLLISGDSVGNGAELYDPATGTWSLTGNLNVARRVFTATLLKNGKVIVAGGSDDTRTNVLSSAELYDPATGIWSSTGNLITGRSDHTANLLPSGKVLVAGGFVDYATGQVTNSAELYDPATGTWTNTGNLNRGRTLNTATLLMAGKVLVAGGFFIDGLPNITESCELYDPATGTWSNTTSLNIGRRFHTATLLLNGKILAAGGSGFPKSAELYDPGLNPIEFAQFFVRQHYLDFLNREPDGPGWDHWTGEITMCTDAANRLPAETEAQCIDRKRANTSGAFYLSNEFQNSANFLIRINWGSLGQDRAIGRKCIVGQYSSLDAVCNPVYSQYITDMGTLTQGIVVNDALVPSQMTANRISFTNAFVGRAAFTAVYGGLNDTQYVDTLAQTTAVALTSQERSDLISQAGAPGSSCIGFSGFTSGRACVLYKIVDGSTTNSDGSLNFTLSRYGQAYYNQTFNPAFVFVQYLAYLRRNPDQAGFDHWLGKLTLYGNFVDAEMVRSFIVSDEYRRRFGPN